MRNRQWLDTELLFSSDAELNKIFPVFAQELSRKYWTPLLIAKESASFLAADGPGVNILDIGSGTGKFCIAGGYFYPEANFYGVEQRERFVALANETRDLIGLTNAHFFHNNFTELDYSQFDHFYFYNSFYENLSGSEKIDDSVNHSADLYNYYTRFLYRQLDLKPPGTRLVTYFSLEDEVPSSYHVVNSSRQENLKFWIKI